MPLVFILPCLCQLLKVPLISFAVFIVLTTLTALKLLSVLSALTLSAGLIWLTISTTKLSERYWPPWYYSLSCRMAYFDRNHQPTLFILTAPWFCGLNCTLSYWYWLQRLSLLHWFSWSAHLSLLSWQHLTLTALIVLDDLTVQLP